MARSKELIKLHCACGALAYRATPEGLERHCRRCGRRSIIPFSALGSLEKFTAYWRASLEREHPGR